MHVDGGLRHLGQLFIGCLFFGKRLFEQLCSGLESEGLCERTKRSIGGNLIVFNLLRRSDYSRVQHYAILRVFHNALGF